MKIVTPEEIRNNQKYYIDEIKAGKVFIYPTDTVLGLGANALISSSVERIFNIKKRYPKPFLIIVPSFGWIEENCLITEDNFIKLKSKLPGPYSFIVKLKNKSAINNKVNNDQDTIGIRIPDSWFTDVIKEANITFVTTSVNFAGEPPIIKLTDIPDEILNQVDYIIDDPKFVGGKPSTIIDFTGTEEKTIRK